MENIVIKDAAIFNELFEIGLLNHFFKLPWVIHTTDFVVYELQHIGLRDVILAYQEKKFLHTATFEPNELQEIQKLHKTHEHTPGITLTDCSVWYYAKKSGFTLLTDDRKLKNSLQKDGVVVRGILYIFNSLVNSAIISTITATEKLYQFHKRNQRINKDDIEKLIKYWDNANHRKEVAYG